MQLQIQPTSIRPTRGDMNSQAADKGPHEVQINECAGATQPQHICTFQSMASVQPAVTPTVTLNSPASDKN